MNSKKQLILILLVSLVAMLFYAGFRMFSRDDKALIRKTIYAAALAIEKGDRMQCAEFISSSYSDPYNETKEDLLNRLSRIFGEYQAVKVKIRGVLVQTEPSGQADIAYVAYLTKKTNNKEYYDSAKLKMNFKKENQVWKITSLEYLNSRDMLVLQEVA